MDMFLHIKKVESILDTDARNHDEFSRISRIFRVLSVYMTSEFAQRMSKLNRIKGTVTKTNVLKKNPNYRKILALWEFLRSYENVGYTIRVVEQNPEVNEVLQRDIFHNVLFNYLVLKGYLQDEEDRKLPAPAREKKRTLKPKFIKEIIEELTEDYDLPDVEVRKVLIEELTKAELMNSFRRAYNTSINKYLTDVRITRARYLLAETEDSIREVSANCGFSDQGYFTKVFSAEAGFSPTEFRARLRKDREETEHV